MLRSDITPFRCWLGGAVVAALAVVSGCAHQQSNNEEEKATAEIEELKSRLQELEKTNGRLSVRVDEMEDEIFLLQDRVEAHRLALQRRKQMQQQQKGEGRARAPSPTPETNYGGEGRYQIRQGRNQPPARDRGQPNRGENGYRQPVKRIPLGKQRRGSTSTGQSSAKGGQSAESRQDASAEGQSAKRDESDESATQGQNRQERGKQSPTDARDSSDSIVITDEDFRKFAVGSSSGNDSESPSDSGESTSNDEEPSGAQKSVTDEKLATSEEMDDEPRPEKPADGKKPFDGKSGLDLYKTALAKYRSGEYATALKGFESFLDGNPRKDYQDNGLYWIGECHFGMGDYRTAVEYFQRLLDEQPDGNKVPDAMLKMALAYRELGMSDKARGLLEKLTRRYPSTNAGRLGKKKLSDLES